MGLFKKEGGPDPASIKKVEALLSSNLGIPVNLGAGKCNFKWGSSQLEIELRKKDEALGHPETLAIYAYVLFAAPYDESIYRYLMTESNTPYIEWQVDEQTLKDESVVQTVTCGTYMLMSTVTQENIDFLLAIVAQCAVSWDYKLQMRFGGYRAEEII
jgi:hypothetical protein